MNLLAELQDAVAARLSADDYFKQPVTVPVLVDHAGDADVAIARALQKAGIGLVILTPLFQAGAQRYSWQVTLEVEINEHAQINRSRAGSKKESLDIALNVMGLLTDWAGGEVWTPFECRGVARVGSPMVDLVPQPLCHVVTFLARTIYALGTESHTTPET